MKFCKVVALHRFGFAPSWLTTFRAYSQYSEHYPDIRWKIIKSLDEVEFPPEKRRLPILPRAPEFHVFNKVVKEPRRLSDYRGPEEFKNYLNYKQYGIQALEGGELSFGHLEVIRSSVNRKLDDRKFAVWGVEAPWKPKTQRSKGKRMGGGKAEVHHYVTPIKAGRIIVEMGGYLDWREAYWILHRISMQMPIRARFVSQDLLNAEALMEQYIEAHNVNPFSAKLCFSRNYGGCHNFISPYYLDWGSIDYK